MWWQNYGGGGVGVTAQQSFDADFLLGLAVDAGRSGGGWVKGKTKYG